MLNKKRNDINDVFQIELNEQAILSDTNIKFSYITMKDIFLIADTNDEWILRNQLDDLSTTRL